MQNLNNWQPQVGTVPTTMASSFSSEGNPVYMTGTPNAQVTVPVDSATLQMFTAQNGYSDSGASSQMGTIAQSQTGNEMAGEVPGMDQVGTYEPKTTT
jgi:hypothetical protein